MACCSGEIETVGWVVEKRTSNVNELCGGRTLLMEALRQGDHDVARYLINLDAVDLDARGWYSETALYYVCSRTSDQRARASQYDIIEKMIALGASLFVEEESGMTPLMSICQFCANADIPMLMIANGASVMFRDEDGELVVSNIYEPEIRHAIEQYINDTRNAILEVWPRDICETIMCFV